MTIVEQLFKKYFLFAHSLPEPAQDHKVVASTNVQLPSEEKEEEAVSSPSSWNCSWGQFHL